MSCSRHELSWCYTNIQVVITYTEYILVSTSPALTQEPLSLPCQQLLASQEMKGKKP